MQLEQFDISKKDDLKRIEQLGIALASPIRVNILNQINEQEKSLGELAKLNLVSFSSIMFHVAILEKSDLIKVIEVKSNKGLTKMVRKGCLQVNLSLLSTTEKEKLPDQIFSQSIPIGGFKNAEFGDNNGYVLKDRTINIYSNSPYHEKRFEAGILYANKGYVEYSFDNSKVIGKDIGEISFSLEICSETPFFNNNFQSLIGFSINEVEVCTYLSPGDFGGRKGLLNPPTYSEFATQYGQLLKIGVNSLGVYLNGLLVNSDIKIQDLNIEQNNCIMFKVESKKNKNNYGGFNIFGHEFGDYPQDIEMVMTFKEK